MSNIEELPYTNAKEKAIFRVSLNNSLLDFTKYFCKVLRGEEFKVNWHHYFICAILERVYYQKDKNVIINTPPGSSKCQVAGDKVFTKRGWIPVEDVSVGDVVYSYRDGKLFFQNVVATESFDKECYEIETTTHAKIRTSHDHPVLTHKGWKYAEDLTDKDFVFQLCSPIDGIDRIPDAELDLITLLLFEGGCTGQTTMFTTADKEVLDVFYSCVEALGMSVSVASKYGYRIKQGCSGVMTELRKKYGLDGKLSIHKRMPLQFFNMPLDQKYRFLGLMIATDGFVAVGKGMLGITLGSRELAQDIKLFLMTCGIVSTYTESKNGFAGAHTVTINGFECKKLLGKINCSQKQKKFEDIFIKPRFNLLYGYPKEVIKGLNCRKGKLRPRIACKDKRGFIGLPAFDRICSELDPSRISWKKDDFIYDKIRSTKKIGTQKVYHIQVEATVYDDQNYIANGIVVHNSSLVSTFWPLWCYSKNPHCRFMLTSYSDDLVESLSQSIKDVFDSAEYKDLYPGYSFKLDSNRKDSWILQKHNRDIGEFFCASIRGRLTGHRGGYLTEDFSGALILDDVNKPADCVSEAKRAEAFDLVYNTVRSRKANSSVPMVVVQQRLAEEDVSGMLMERAKSDGWVVYKIPALIDEDYYNTLPKWLQNIAEPNVIPQLKQYGVSSYWPEKETIEELNSIKGVDPFTFNAQYMQDPKSRTGNMINTTWFKTYNNLPEKFDAIYFFADTAAGVKTYNDYSVITAVGEYQNHVYILDMMRGKYEFPDLVREAKSFISRVGQRYKESRLGGVYIEFKSSGQGLVQTLTRETSLPIIDFSPRADKVLRVSQVLPYIEAGRVLIPESSPWLDAFLFECANFLPTMQHKHDDMVDTLSSALTILFINKIKVKINELRY